MRDIKPVVLHQFRGISQYVNVFGAGIMFARDTRNVIVSASGFLEKLRSPQPRTPVLSVPPNPIERFIDFQQGNGSRRIVFSAPNVLGYYTDDAPPALWTFHSLESYSGPSGIYRFVTSNNVLFMANGVQMRKWTGIGSVTDWGIDKPVTPPTIGVTVPITSIVRAGAVATVTLNLSSAVPGAPSPNVFFNLAVGSLIKITGYADPTFNVTVSVITSSGSGSFTASMVGPNATVGAGSALIYSLPAGIIGAYDITAVQRINGVSKVVFANNHVLQTEDGVTVSGLTPPHDTFNGAWTTIGEFADGVSWSQIGEDIAVGTAASGPGKIVGGITTTLGTRSWRYSYKDSILGHEGPASDLTYGYITTSNVGLIDHLKVFLQAAPPPPNQGIDTICWYASYDAGGDWFLDDEIPIAGVNGLWLFDGKGDDFLDATQRANFVNFPPPVGSILVEWEGRIYVAGITGAEQDVAYSAFEKCLRGRPEQSFFPSNRIRLSLGANGIRGLGMLMNGAVIWDSDNRMFMLKGSVEDFVTDAPINWTEQLESLPWQAGVGSPDSVISTPYGVIWFGSDSTFHRWNGIFYAEIIAPEDIGINIQPILRRITDGQKGNVEATYFNFLERDWYVALIAVDGSQSPNLILFFDMTKEAKDNLGIWISDIQADSIGVTEDVNGNRHLMVGRGGQLFEIKCQSTATAGVHLTITTTTSQLQGFWQSGYDGSESSQIMKMFRWGRLITDQHGFRLLTEIVNDTSHSIQNPRQREVKLDASGRFTVNWHGRRISYTIIFPGEDVDASVLELAYNYFNTAVR